MKEELIGVTLEFGSGMNEMPLTKKDEEEPNKDIISVNYDCISSRKEEILQYHINKIIYTLNENQSIQSLKVIYKNRNNGNLETMLDTIVSHRNDEKEEEIELEDLEEIDNVFFYIKKDQTLASICIETNLGNIKYIGNQDKGELVKAPEFEEGKRKIILGFGVQAAPKFGVTSLYCYYMKKNIYGLYQYNGLLQLRAKLKNNPEYKKEIEEQKTKLNEKQRLINEVCNLPDTAFFPIASYIMSN